MESFVTSTFGQRMDFLIKHLEGNNAKVFADKTGIDPSTLSRVRSGKLPLKKGIDSILKAYPAVSRMWLETGKGYPGDLSIELCRTHMLEMIQAKDRVILALSRELELQREIIEEYRKG